MTPQYIKEKATRIIEKKKELEIFTKKCKIEKNYIKEIRMFLQEVEDTTEVYDDCDLSQGYYIPKQEILSKLINSIDNAKILEENRIKLEKERRLTWYCYYCLSKISEDEEMKKCYDSNCKNYNLT